MISEKIDTSPQKELIEPTDLTKISNPISISKTEKYNEFIESSDVLTEFYKHQKTFGLEKYFIQIEDWLAKPVDSPEDNMPLVIEAEEGIGKKTLLVKWIQHRQSTCKQDFEDVIITHFASAGGNNSNSFYAIYRILIKLREVFNINQKVELLEEKIRKNFSYWLDLCSTKAEKSVIYDGRVILIIEGLENFFDFETGFESNIKFWLPKNFPKHIRVITTAAKTSKSYAYLKRMGSHIIEMKAEKGMLNDKLGSLSRRLFFCSDIQKNGVFTILKQRIQNNEISSLFMKIAISCFSPYVSKDVLEEGEVDNNKIQAILKDVDWTIIEESYGAEELIQEALAYFENKIMGKDKFKKILVMMTLTLKGLRESEILEICEITREQWKIFVTFFKAMFFTFRGYWKVGNDTAMRVIKKVYHKDQQYLVNLHLEIAFAMGKLPQSIRGLEEITNHYFLAGDFFSLKQTIASIEAFLLLFNPYTKYDLCRYWQVLEGKGYDPVVEYNKGLELFDTHFSPKPEDLFTIILQISRFLKEFSDFETKNTPKFRHPFIKGKVVKDIREEKEEDPLFKRKTVEKKTPEHEIVEKRDVMAFLKAHSQEAKEFFQKMKQNTRVPGEKKPLPFKEDYEILNEVELKNEKDEKREGTMSYLNVIGLEREIRNMCMTEQLTDPILQPHERVNVTVKSGKERFLQYFKDLLKKNNSRKQLYQEETQEPCFYIGEEDGVNEKYT